MIAAAFLRRAATQTLDGCGTIWTDAARRSASRFETPAQKMFDTILGLNHSIRIR
jgi:hypothetical protein